MEIIKMFCDKCSGEIAGDLVEINIKGDTKAIGRVRTKYQLCEYCFIIAQAKIDKIMIPYIYKMETFLNKIQDKESEEV